MLSLPVPGGRRISWPGAASGASWSSTIMKEVGDVAPGPGRTGLSSSATTRSGPGLLPVTLLCSLFLRDLLDALERSPASIGSGPALPLYWITFCGVFGKFGRPGPTKNLEAFSGDR